MTTTSPSSLLQATPTTPTTRLDWSQKIARARAQSALSSRCLSSAFPWLAQAARDPPSERSSSGGSNQPADGLQELQDRRPTAHVPSLFPSEGARKTRFLARARATLACKASRQRSLTANKNKFSQSSRQRQRRRRPSAGRVHSAKDK